MTPTDAQVASTPAGQNDRVSAAIAGFRESLANNLGPSEEEIRDALQRHFNERIGFLSPTADDCRTIRERNDTIDAIRCLLSGGGQLTGNSATVNVQSVSIENCSRLESGLVLCHYRANAQMTGGGNMMGGAADIFNSAIASGRGVYATFARSNGVWRLIQSYSSCNMSGEQVSCR